MTEPDYTCFCGHTLGEHLDNGRCRIDKLDAVDLCECAGYMPKRGRRELDAAAWRPTNVTMSDGQMLDENGQPITFVPVRYLLDLQAEVTDHGGTTIVRAERDFAAIDLDFGALGTACLAYVDETGPAAVRVKTAIRAYLWSLANVSKIPGFGHAAPTYAQLQAAMESAKGMNR